jgi:hypothetical protein
MPLLAIVVSSLAIVVPPLAMPPLAVPPSLLLFVIPMEITCMDMADEY